MNIRGAVPSVVLGLGAVVAAAAIATVVMSEAPDYAELVPAPDTIVWEEGDETPLWLSTNRDVVDLRIDSVSLGIGNISRVFPQAGESMILGRAEGCQDWAVSRLAASFSASGNDTSVALAGEIDRNSYNQTVTVHWQYYEEGDRDTRIPGTSIDLVSSANSFSPSFIASGGVYIVEASSDAKFPEVFTRQIRVDVGAETSTVDSEAEGLQMLSDTGVGIIACSEHQDVLITLHGDEDEELNRYLVDVKPDPTPVATPTSDAGYVTRRICVDAADHQMNYLDGGETVGAAITLPTGGTVTFDDVAEGNDYVYFFNYSGTLTSGGTTQLTVSEAGASTFGLDSDRVYAVVFTATRAGVPDDPTTAAIFEYQAERTETVKVGVWLDTSTLSPGDDGRCT